MGKLKQLHIDCTPNECVVSQPETCYMLEREMTAKDMWQLADLLVKFQTAYPQNTNDCEVVRTAVVNYAVAKEAE